jgi:hypothetical protein
MGRFGFAVAGLAVSSLNWDLVAPDMEEFLEPFINAMARLAALHNTTHGTSHSSSLPRQYSNVICLLVKT